MRFLILGGAGFVGSHLVDRFISEGHRVVVMDNLITGNMDNVAHHIGNTAFEFIHHDVSNYIHVPGPIDGIFQFASPASPDQYLKYPIQTLKVGALGTHNSLGLALAKKARFVLASTSEIYGDPLEHPQKESYNGNVDPIGPRGVYDEAKRFAEALVMAYHRTHGLETRIVRIFNTYGPRMSLDDGRVVPNFIKQALLGKPLTVYGDGEQTRSFQYVDDLVNGVHKLFFSSYSEPVNIGTTDEISILQFAEEVNKIANNSAGIKIYEDKRIKGDPQTRQPDNTRAREILDWEPTVSLADGLQRTVDFFRDKVNDGGEG